MKKLVCALLISSFILTIAGAEMKAGQPAGEETVESLKQELRVAQYNGEKRNPEHAIFWSIFPGGGQVYNGEYIKAGLAYAAVVFSALAGWSNVNYIILPFIVWTCVACDAYITAENYNNGLKKKYGISSIQLLDTSLFSSLR